MSRLVFGQKEYNFKLHLSALRLYAMEQGMEKFKTKDIPEVMQEADLIHDYPVMIWAGLKVGADDVGRTFDNSVEEVKEWLKDHPSTFDRAVELINEDADAGEAPESLGNSEKVKSKK